MTTERAKSGKRSRIGRVEFLFKWTVQLMLYSCRQDSESTDFRKLSWQEECEACSGVTEKDKQHVYEVQCILGEGAPERAQVRCSIAGSNSTHNLVGHPPSVTLLWVLPNKAEMR